ncbi:uncharacterized protein F4822DRAFT_142898 [Hypoxylon trugodes]|uniref:uncharacterized protein n=1 Tax=Hypoxylon trugodes TaxID=326681 RepID=UPI00219740E4|nr:uncharacterized protein F4822DRAFT_142898 [Hypoxylon trugodes]KAI1392844.1 hypothetical protein F4822DRAFT_142898 [Hypoxylon trugodes]
MPFRRWFSKRSTATIERREKSGLFILHSPQADIDVDIVAVHGLSGDWEQTWTDDEDQKLWLRDFLPIEYPNARVWSFGYDASVLGKAVGDIDDVATTLVHILDGKRKLHPQALNLAKERSDHWEDIASSTVGIMFFGVPHRGADAAYWADFAASVISFASLGLQGNRNFVKDLKKNSREFSNISKAFIQPASKIKTIHSFYETVKIGNNVVVDRNSASLNINNELAAALEGTDHRNMCKFRSVESQKYQQVRLALDQMVPSVAIASPDVDRQICELVQQIKFDPQAIVSDDTHDFRWMINMPQTRSWETTEGYKPLYVKYNIPLSCQISLSYVFHEHLRSENAGTYWGLAPIDDSRTTEWNMEEPAPSEISCPDPELLPLALSTDTKTFALINNADGNNAESNRARISWQDVFCSETSSWEKQWIILFCALTCLDSDTFLLFVGFNDEMYEALALGLKFLHPKCYGTGLKSSSNISLPPD